jgi:hypothetical protein
LVTRDADLLADETLEPLALRLEVFGIRHGSAITVVKTKLGPRMRCWEKRGRKRLKRATVYEIMLRGLGGVRGERALTSQQVRIAQRRLR